MINLLPPDVKTNYHYGRLNRVLRRWIIAISAALLGAVLLTLSGAVFLQASINHYTRQSTATSAELKAQHVDTVQKEVTTISNNLKLTVQVLSKEILFSQLLKKLGSVTPSNAVLTNLAISQTQGAIDITALTANYDAATQMQVNLADPQNQIFSKADIVSITCASNSNNAKYPCTATYRALFATDNPFLFINDGKKAKP